MSRNRNLSATFSRTVVMLAITLSGVASMGQSRGQGVQGRGSAPRQPAQAQRQQQPQRQPIQGEQAYRERLDQRASRSGRWDVESTVASERRADRLARGERSESMTNERWLSERRRSGLLDKPVYPRKLPRALAIPNRNYWGWRYNSIFHDIMFVTRGGYIPVTAIPADVDEVTDYSLTPAGWRGYGIVVPPGETVDINLEHPNRGWFRLIFCDKWGNPLPGGLSSTLRQHTPHLTYTNPSDTPRAIYLLVDDPGWMSSDANPYALQLTRSWSPHLVPVDQSLIISGIWGIERSINARFRSPMLVMPGFK